MLRNIDNKHLTVASCWFSLSTHTATFETRAVIYQQFLRKLAHEPNSYLLVYRYLTGSFMYVSGGTIRSAVIYRGTRSYVGSTIGTAYI